MSAIFTLGAVAIIYGGGQVPPANLITGLIAETLINMNYVVYGVHKSFMGMADSTCYERFDALKAKQIQTQIGTYLATCRKVEPDSDEYFEKIFNELRKRAIHTLIIPGGDGSSRAAAAFLKKMREKNYPFRILFIPCTIDGIENSDSIGLDSAVQLTYKHIQFIIANAFATYKHGFETGRIAIIETQGRNRNDISYYASKMIAESGIKDFHFIPAAYKWSVVRELEFLNTVKKEFAVIIPEGARPIERYWDAISGKGPGSKLENMIVASKYKEVNLNEIGYLGQTCDVSAGDKKKCEIWVKFLEKILRQTEGKWDSYALIMNPQGLLETMPIEDFAAATNSDVAIPLTEEQQKEMRNFLP